MYSIKKLKSPASNPSSAGFVRPLEKGDVARVAELHERVMPKNNHAPIALMRAQLSRILLQHPWYNESLPSLVYEENGKVVGCIGVMPRPMLFRDRPITAAISHSFIVEPGSRSALAALELAKRFMAGPQDLSLAEGGNVSRKIWEKVGGSVSLLYSLCWTRPLKPSRYVLSFLRKRGLSPALGWGLRPLCQLVDAVAPFAGRTFRLRAPPGFADALDGPTLCRSVSEFTKDRSLRPQYDDGALNWLLETLEHKQGRGALHRVLVRNARHETIGWYLYYGAAGEVGAVVQMGAKHGCAEEVLDHLFYHAKQHGVVALSGQVDPALFHVYSRSDCLFHHDGGSWMLVHSRDPALLQAIDRGDAFLTRLEGEWWIGSLLNPS
jgi:hypothetical protein